MCVETNGYAANRKRFSGELRQKDSLINNMGILERYYKLKHSGTGLLPLGLWSGLGLGCFDDFSVNFDM